MDSEKKKVIIDDHMSFYDDRESYKKMEVSGSKGSSATTRKWQDHHHEGDDASVMRPRGSSPDLIHSVACVYEFNAVGLYIRSLLPMAHHVQFYGSERSVGIILEKGRAMAPCYLIMEVVDTIVTNAVKSYFFNEVDGLKSDNDIFILGSTNHLDRMDLGISVIAFCALPILDDTSIS